MKRIWKIILIITGIFLFLFCGLTLLMPSFVMTGHRQTLTESREAQSQYYDTSFYDKLDKADYTVPGYEGYSLHVELLRNPSPSSDYVILSHGYTDNRFGSLKYVPMYMDLGFNCIVYDLRGHGENDPTVTTYGIREAQDLMCLIADTRTRYPDLTCLGLHGESLGAASTITCLKYKPEVDFVVSDCAFSDFKAMLNGIFTENYSPSFLTDLTDFSMQLLHGCSLNDMQPIEALSENEIPILFLHGDKDTLIPPENSETMAEATKGFSEFHTIPNAGHAQSVIVNPELYETYVDEFLSSNSPRSQTPEQQPAA